MSTSRIVIVGAGFGGTYVARRLAKHVRSGKLSITLIDRSNHFLFTPLLHEVATGGLSAASVAEPLREAFVGTSVNVLRAEVTGVDRQAKNVTVDGTTIPYDYLVVATGASTNTYGIAGVEEYATGLKDLRDAITIKNKIIDAFEKADALSDTTAQAEALSFVIVGAGPTGVELGAEIAEFSELLYKRYHHCQSGSPLPKPRITLISAAPDLLAQFKPEIRTQALNRLKKIGIDVRVSMTVTSVDEKGIAFSDGSRIDASLVVWAAGVKAAPPVFLSDVPKSPSGRLAVEPTLLLKSDSTIFVLGDSAESANEKNPKGDPMLAQVAVQQADVVAKNILASIERQPLYHFEYSSKGGLVSLGQGYGVGEVFGTAVSGWIAWLMWRTVYIMKFPSWKKRIRIMFEWAFELFYPRDITRVRQ